MLNHKKEVEINGKLYTLTVRRTIVYKIASIVPEVLKIYKESNEEGKQLSQEQMLMLFDTSVIDKLYDNMNLIFYEMIKVQHKDITLEKSNEIYSNFHNEYNDVDDKLLTLIEKVFTQGVPRENKKNLDW